MQIIIFTQGSLQFVDVLPSSAPTDGFVWVFTERETFETDLPKLQTLAQQVGGSAVLDLHCHDLASNAHPSDYDYTSVYDLVIFRRLISATEIADVKLANASKVAQPSSQAIRSRKGGPPVFNRIDTRAVGFVQFDKLLISIHPTGCYTAKTFVERYLKDALHSEQPVHEQLLHAVVCLPAPQT